MQRHDPVFQAARIDAIRRRADDPAYRAKMSEVRTTALETLRLDPEYMEALRANGRTVGRVNLRKGHEPAARLKAGEAIRRVQLAWCPEKYWPLNATLKRKGILLPERKRIIAEEVERASPEAEARRIISGVDADMRAKAERQKREAY